MKKHDFFERFLDISLPVLFCVIFTIVIIIEAITNTIVGAEVNLGIDFVVWVCVFLIAPILPLALLKRLWKSTYIAEKNQLYLGSLLLHYLISCGLMMFFTFMQGFFEPLQEGLYLFRFVMYTAIYVVTIIGAIIIDLARTANDNENLRKLHAIKRNTNKT